MNLSNVNIYSILKLLFLTLGVVNIFRNVQLGTILYQDLFYCTLNIFYFAQNIFIVDKLFSQSAFQVSKYFQSDKKLTLI